MLALHSNVLILRNSKCKVTVRANNPLAGQCTSSSLGAQVNKFVFLQPLQERSLARLMWVSKESSSRYQRWTSTFQRWFYLKQILLASPQTFRFVLYHQQQSHHIDLGLQLWLQLKFLLCHGFCGKLPYRARGSRRWYLRWKQRRDLRGYLLVESLVPTW